MWTGQQQNDLNDIDDLDDFGPPSGLPTKDRNSKVSLAAAAAPVSKPPLP